VQRRLAGDAELTITGVVPSLTRDPYATPRPLIPAGWEMPLLPTTFGG